ncbi:hypothetical protein BCR43DRAFT_491403, partial [Syncephalastrum racemosum]
SNSMSTHPHVSREVQRKPAESRSPTGISRHDKSNPNREAANAEQKPNSFRASLGQTLPRQSQLEITHRGKDNDTTMAPM